MKAFIPIVAVAVLSTLLVDTVYADNVQEKRQEVLEKQQEVKEKQQELKQETLKASAEQMNEANKTMQQMSRASKIIGTKVKNLNGDRLGDIKELVVDPNNGQVVYAVVSYGGILGMGDKLFAVPWKALHWASDKDYYTLDLDKDTLKKAPGFDKEHWPDSSSQWDQWREEIEQFYHRVTP